MRDKQKAWEQENPLLNLLIPTPLSLRLPAAHAHRRGTYQYAVCLFLFYQIGRGYARNFPDSTRISGILAFHFRVIKSGPDLPNHAGNRPCSLSLLHLYVCLFKSALLAPGCFPVLYIRLQLPDQAPQLLRILIRYFNLYGQNSHLLSIPVAAP